MTTKGCSSCSVSLTLSSIRKSSKYFLCALQHHLTLDRSPICWHSLRRVRFPRFYCNREMSACFDPLECPRQILVCWCCEIIIWGSCWQSSRRNYFRPAPQHRLVVVPHDPQRILLVTDLLRFLTVLNKTRSLERVVFLDLEMDTWFRKRGVLCCPRPPWDYRPFCWRPI